MLTYVQVLLTRKDVNGNIHNIVSYLPAELAVLGNTVRIQTVHPRELWTVKEMWGQKHENEFPKFVDPNILDEDGW